MDNLTKELTRIIFGTLGFIPPPNFNKVGMSTDHYLTNLEIPVSYENGDSEVYSIWSGESKPYGDILRVAATAIINEKYCEFNAIYKMNDYPIHAIKSSYYDQDEVPNLYLKDNNGKWQEL